MGMDMGMDMEMDMEMNMNMKTNMNVNVNMNKNMKINRFVASPHRFRLNKSLDILRIVYTCPVCTGTTKQTVSG
jgi:hypothetical protein